MAGACIYAGAKDEGSLQDPGEPVDQIDVKMMSETNSFFRNRYPERWQWKSVSGATKFVRLTHGRMPCRIVWFGFRRIRWGSSEAPNLSQRRCAENAVF